MLVIPTHRGQARGRKFKAILSYTMIPKTSWTGLHVTLFQISKAKQTLEMFKSKTMHITHNLREFRLPSSSVSRPTCYPMGKTYLKIVVW